MIQHAAPYGNKIDNNTNTLATTRKNSKTNLKEPSSFMQDTTAISITNNEVSFLDQSHISARPGNGSPDIHNEYPGIMNTEHSINTARKHPNAYINKNHQKSVQHPIMTDRGNPFKNSKKNYQGGSANNSPDLSIEGTSKHLNM